MKLNPNKEYYEQEFGWVAHPDGGNAPEENVLVARRYEIDILGGVLDEEASYEYDEWALCKLDVESLKKAEESVDSAWERNRI